jgi:hypothetical protein
MKVLVILAVSDPSSGFQYPTSVFYISFWWDITIYIRSIIALMIVSITLSSLAVFMKDHHGCFSNRDGKTTTSAAKKEEDWLFKCGMPFFYILQHSCDMLVRIACSGQHHGAHT